jgi:flagellin
MPNSINTNVGAMVALRNLNSVNRDLDAVQNRVSTGLRVSSAQEDASVFSVAQGIRSDLRGYEAVGGALSGARGILSVAISGATQASNIMADIREKLTQLSDEGISQDQREIYSADLKSQFEQLRSFIEGAVYNEKNLLTGGKGTNVTAGNGQFGSYSLSDDAKVVRSIDGTQLTVRAQDLLIGDTDFATEVNAFMAFARVIYTTDTAGAAATDGQTAADIGGGAASTFSSGVDANGNLVARQFVGARIAQAALADVNADGTRSTTAFFSSDTATVGTDSVFNSAFAFFERELSLALGELGADNRAVEFQIDFNTSIRDAVEEGLGSLVDADLARESARLQALQTKQQLSIQTLSIANQSPTILLSLFQ